MRKRILDYTTITSPLDGRTGIRLVDEGNIVRALRRDRHRRHHAAPADRGPVHAAAAAARRGQPAFAEGPLPVDAFGPDNKTVIEIAARCKVVDNQVDQTTGTIKLKAEFPNANFQLWPGQFVNVRLLINTLRNVVVVPTAAVQRGPNGTFVFVVEPDNTVAVRPVTVTQQDETQAVIARGLGADERVVTTGFARLTAGSEVARDRTPQSAPPPTPSRSTARQQRRRGVRGRGRDAALRAPDRARRDERLHALHPAADRDLAAWRSPSCWAAGSAISRCRCRRCRRSISRPSRSRRSFPAPARAPSRRW